MFCQTFLPPWPARALHRPRPSGGAALWRAVRETIINMAKMLAEQRIFFDDHIAPIFDKRLVRWLTGRRLSLYGLGIPPAQYEKLAGGRSMAEVLIERLRKLACDFPLRKTTLPGRLSRGAMTPARRQRCRSICSARISGDQARRRPDHAYRRLVHRVPQGHPADSLDRYVLLDAQDWMTDEQLNELWARSPARRGRKRGSSSAPPAKRPSCPAVLPPTLSRAGPMMPNARGSWRHGPLGDLWRVPSLSAECRPSDAMDLRHGDLMDRHLSAPTAHL